MSCRGADLHPWMLHSVCIVVVLKESSVRCASAGDWSFVRGQAGGEFLELFQRDTPAALQHPPEGARHREREIQGARLRESLFGPRAAAKSRDENRTPA